MRIAFLLLSCLPMLLFSAKAARIGKGGFKTVLEADFVYLKPKNTGTSHCLAKVDTASGGVGSGGSGCAAGGCKFNAKDLYHSQSWDPGLRASLSFLPNCRSTWELLWMGFLDWDSYRTARCNGTLEFPFRGVNPTIDWIDDNRIKGRIHTKFWDAEGNYYRHLSPQRVDAFSVSWLVGLRYVDLKERFRLTSFADSDSSYYKINTWNEMGGLQIGGLFESNLSYNFTWGLSLKLGGMVNHVRQKSLWLDDNNTDTLLRENPDDMNFSLLGELTPYFLFHLFDRIYLRAAFQGLYIGNIAQTTRQIKYTLDVDSPPRVDTDAHYILYGGQLGLGFIF